MPARVGFFVYGDFEGVFFLDDFFFFQIEGRIVILLAFEDANFDVVVQEHWGFVPTAVGFYLAGPGG